MPQRQQAMSPTVGVVVRAAVRVVHSTPDSKNTRNSSFFKTIPGVTVLYDYDSQVPVELWNVVCAEDASRHHGVVKDFVDWVLDTAVEWTDW